MGKVRLTALGLSAAIVVIYLAQLLFPGLTDLFSLTVTELSRQPWTFITAMFIHSPTDYMHLLNNLFFLAVFGFMLEQVIGTRRFLAVFFAAGLVANLSAFTFYPNSSVLGASGAISGVVATIAVLRPRAPGLFWGVPVPMWAALVGWFGINLVGAGEANTAFMAHLYGLVFGVFCGLYLRNHHPHPDEDEEHIHPDDPDIDVEAWEDEWMRQNTHEGPHHQHRD